MDRVLLGGMRKLGRGRQSWVREAVGVCVESGVWGVIVTGRGRQKSKGWGPYCLSYEIGYERAKAYGSTGENGENESDSHFGEGSSVGWKGRTSAPPPRATVGDPKAMK